MRWDRSHRSRDVVDRRGERYSGGGGGGGGVGLGLLSLALRSRYGWILLVLYLAYRFFFEGGLRHDAAEVEGPRPSASAPADDLGAFVGFVLDDLQDMWSALLPSAEGRPYERAKLVLFTGATPTACGVGESATGPFYCPADRQVYIDLDFYSQLRTRLGAPGDFAQAYVIAHEVGHHVQNLLGTSERVHLAGRTRGDGGLAVRLELQADCYAGVWAHSAHARGLLEVGDVDEALTAAAAIGDDALQRQATGRVRPETFSHGTSAQRSRWFRRGLESGQPSACDTFSAREL